MWHNVIPLTAAQVGAAERSSEVFHSMGSGFRDKQENFHPAELLLWMLVLVAAFWGLNLISRLMTRVDRRRQRFNPRALFRALCRAHELDAGSVRLLKQLAAHHELDYAAEIFVSPAAFAIESLSPSLKSHAGEVTALAEKLLGGQAVLHEGPREHQEQLTLAREASAELAALLAIYPAKAEAVGHAAGNHV